ncbi:unnamed protein product [Prorocentrum cordatum]|uniref:Late endosomal/lysosomal adaptor and MAPK and MTOR activator 5 n=1 Tax=Prorocentrum cordatum TaxID=2364126 RepID=A0ABN9Q916_9DINO|nr:unnamed protein product [Polarella glacialis]
MDACATSRAVSGSDEVHLALAEQLFDSIRHPSDVDGALPGAPADGGDRGARISTSDLARVIRACADTMEGETGVCIAVDDLGVPLAPCGAVPDDSQPDQPRGASAGHLAAAGRARVGPVPRLEQYSNIV